MKHIQGGNEHANRDLAEEDLGAGEAEHEEPVQENLRIELR